LPKLIQPTAIGKICTKCGADKTLSNFYTSGKKVNETFKYNSWCKQCIKTKMASYHKNTWGPDKLQFSAFKRTKTPRSYLTYLLGKARRRGECSIDVNYLCNIWESQKGLCAITEWQMTMRLADGVVSTNASIDRIDSNYGYIPGNVHLVCRCVNVAKHDLTMDEFIMLCVAVVKGKGYD
jgi:hypothetical protein